MITKSQTGKKENESTTFKLMEDRIDDILNTEWPRFKDTATPRVVIKFTDLEIFIKEVTRSQRVYFTMVMYFDMAEYYRKHGWNVAIESNEDHCFIFS